jgi:predicted dithiol-disulfide oxidoreductase (DUF899 family)
MTAKRKQVSLHSERFPGESADYRNARDRLLEAEIELRRRLEDVAKLRRQLPPGGAVLRDYEFEEGAADQWTRGPTTACCPEIRTTRYAALR